MKTSKKYFKRALPVGFFLMAVTSLNIVSANNYVVYQKNAKNNPIEFKDVSAEPETGITYRRTESESDAIYDLIKQKGTFFMEEGVNLPANSRGAPGVAVFDYDLDGDLDIYVTNGPNTPNSLYSNQLIETGKTHFVDYAEQAGVMATSHDSTGVCYGDIDNDGDNDLIVLSSGSGNSLFENNGDGTFADVSLTSGVGGSNLHASSCSIGDIDNDGYLDIAVANTFPPDNRLPLLLFDQDFLMQHNQLLKNEGNNVFTDVSEASGINNIARITWGISLVDYDQDGDVDLINANDQGPRAPALYNGQDKGYIRIYNNDGQGNFTDLTESLGMNQFGAWMSLSFGDLNHDGYMDIFASNIGDYASVFTAPMFRFGPFVGEWHSSWFFGDKEGGLTRQTAGDIVANPFGWGSSIHDYDNDGDTDLLYHGGLDVGVFIDGSNNGALLKNTGNGEFVRDETALNPSISHNRRNVRGVAVGDLDNNGFVDHVSVSNQNWPESAPLVPYPVVPLNGPFDKDAVIWPTFSQVDPTDISKGFSWNGIEPVDGTLSIELNNGANKNKSVKVSVRGSVGLTRYGTVNRSGIGAIVSFKPRGDEPAMWPIVGGASYASQDSHEWVFGLGRKRTGTLDVMWPGGVRNRLYNVRAGENIVLPEIPCSYDDHQQGIYKYLHCVVNSVVDLKRQELVSRKMAYRLIYSALYAYRQSNGY